MKKITYGNDFALKVSVKRKTKEGEAAFGLLPACSEVSVALVSAAQRYPLEFEIDAAETDKLTAHFKSADFPRPGSQFGASYALEVKGVLWGNAWRSNEYEQVCLVPSNAQNDTLLPDDETEGEESVEMDTAFVIFAPTAETEQLVKRCEEAAEKAAQAATDCETASVKAEEAAERLQGVKFTQNGNKMDITI